MLLFCLFLLCASFLVGRLTGSFALGITLLLASLVGLGLVVVDATFEVKQQIATYDSAN